MAKEKTFLNWLLYGFLSVIIVSFLVFVGFVLYSLLSAT